MPEFFFPRATSPEQAEGWYEATRTFNEEQTGWKVNDRRIFQVRYVHEGRELFAQVGQAEPRTGEPCEAILESNAYLVCTTNRGVMGGSPLLVGTDEVREVVDFD